MVDVKDDDEQTLDKSNSGESEEPADASVIDDTELEEDADAGNTADADSDKKTDTETPEGESKSRGERRHESYIDKLSSEIRDANSKASRYTEELFTPDKTYQPLQYQEGEEYDPKALEEDRKKASENRYAEGVQTGLTQGTTQVVKELWADRLDIDSERVRTKWDPLNEEKPESYNPKLEAHLVQRYVQFVGVERQPNGQITIQKPSIRFRDFVDAEMKNMEDYAQSRNANSSKNLVKQAANTGVRPNGQARSSKSSSFDPNDPVGSVARMSSKEYFEGGGKEASDAYLAKQLGGK